MVSKDVGVLTIRPSLLLQMMKRVKRATGQLIPQKKKGSRLEVVSKDVGVLTIRPSLLLQMMKRVKRATGQLIPQKKKGSRLEVVSKDVGVLTIRPSLLLQMMKRVKRAANTPEEEGISAGSGEQGCRCPDNPSIITISDDEEGEEAIQNEDLATMTMFLCSLIMKYCNFN